MLVRDLMTPDVVTVTPGSTVKAALSRLATLGITAMPVVDADGRLLGIVSELDLIRDAVARDPRAPEGPVVVEALDPAGRVEDVYTRSVLTVGPDDDVAAAVDVMTTTAVKSLVVVDARRHVVGMLSRSDIVRILARDDDVIAADVDDLLSRIGRADWLVEVEEGVVTVAGPGNLAEHSLAHVVAQTVPGVVGVHVEDAG